MSGSLPESLRKGRSVPTLEMEAQEPGRRCGERLERLRLPLKKRRPGSLAGLKVCLFPVFGWMLIKDSEVPEGVGLWQRARSLLWPE